MQTNVKSVLMMGLFLLVGGRKSSAQIVPAHTVIVILENKSYAQIIGNPDAAFINSLLNNSQAALFTQSFGLTHPSQPNYIMLYSGSPQGVTDNNVPPNLPFTTSNLGAALIAKGFTFTGYSEDLPFVGATVATSDLYARKHNPWVNWHGTGVNGIPDASNRPFSDFPADFNLLPTLSFVIPNEGHNMHDGTIAESDAWVQANFDSYVQWCTSNNSLFILTFDEDDGSSSNQIPTILMGADIKHGSYAQPVTHYNVLRTLEEIYALPYAGVSADSAAITGIWLSAQPFTYTFNGNGNWSDASNWFNHIAPPVKTYIGSAIIINPVAGGECLMNVPYAVSKGTSFKVKVGKKIVVKGNLVLQ